jgi:hypothetical protein
VEDLGLAEMAREGDVLLVGDVLLREHQDEMLGPGVDHRLAGRGVDRPAHVDTADFRTESRMAARDSDAHRRQW